MSVIDDAIRMLKGSFKSSFPKDQVVKTAGKEIKDIEVFENTSSLDEYGPKTNETREALKGWSPEDLAKTAGYVGMNDDRFSPLMSYIDNTFDKHVPIQALYNLLTPNKSGARPITGDKFQGGLIRQEEVLASGLVGMLDSLRKEGKKYISKSDLLQATADNLPVLSTQTRTSRPGSLLTTLLSGDVIYTKNVENIISNLKKDQAKLDPEDFRYLALQDKIDSVQEYANRGIVDPDTSYLDAGNMAIETKNIDHVKFGGIYNQDWSNENPGAAYYEYVINDRNWKNYSSEVVRGYENSPQAHWTTANGMPVAHARAFTVNGPDGKHLHVPEVQSDLWNAEMKGDIPKGTNLWGDRYPALAIQQVLTDSVKRGDKFMTFAMGREVGNTSQQQWVMKNPTVTKHYAQTSTGPEMVYSFDFMDEFTAGGRFQPKSLKQRNVTMTHSEVQAYAKQNPEFGKMISKVDLNADSDRAFFPYEEGLHQKVDYQGKVGKDSKITSYGGELTGGKVTQGKYIKVIKDFVGKYGGTIEPYQMTLPPAYDVNGVPMSRGKRWVWKINITPEMLEKYKASGNKFPLFSQADPEDWVKRYNLERGYA